MTILYGIKNCDTVRKARKWLDAHNIEYTFHDVRSDGLDKKDLSAWVKSAGWETLLNRRGTTWRQLPDTAKAETGAAHLLALVLAQPALIKRPVFEVAGEILVGFTPAIGAALQRLAARG